MKEKNDCFFCVIIDYKNKQNQPCFCLFSIEAILKQNYVVSFNANFNCFRTLARAYNYHATSFKLNKYFMNLILHY